MMPGGPFSLAPGNAGQGQVTQALITAHSGMRASMTGKICFMAQP